MTVLEAGTPMAGPMSGSTRIVAIDGVPGERLDIAVEPVTGRAFDHRALDRPVGRAHHEPEPNLGRQPASYSAVMVQICRAVKEHHPGLCESSVRVYERLQLAWDIAADAGRQARKPHSGRSAVPVEAIRLSRSTTAAAPRAPAGTATMTGPAVLSACCRVLILVVHPKVPRRGPGGFNTVWHLTHL